MSTPAICQRRVILQDCKVKDDVLGWAGLGAASTTHEMRLGIDTSAREYE